MSAINEVRGKFFRVGTAVSAFVGRSKSSVHAPWNGDITLGVSKSPICEDCSLWWGLPYVPVIVVEYIPFCSVNYVPKVKQSTQLFLLRNHYLCLSRVATRFNPHDNNMWRSEVNIWNSYFQEKYLFLTKCDYYKWLTVLVLGWV
jgi:hypothetical protein